jgi:hypothetical protein
LKDFILPLFALVGGILSLWVDFFCSVHADGITS